MCYRFRNQLDDDRSLIWCMILNVILSFLEISVQGDPWVCLDTVSVGPARVRSRRLDVEEMLWKGGVVHHDEGGDVMSDRNLIDS